jgi:Protein kinase domain
MDDESLFPDEDPVYDLLAAWDEKRRLGEDPDPATLCPHDLTLQERLRQKIDAQKKLEARLGLEEHPDDRASRVVLEGPPEIPGIVVEEEIGRGAMGIVYRGRQPSLDRVVAVKVIVGGAYAAARERARFRTEAIATARIPHPNIVAVHDSGETGGLPYLVLEYLGGGTLADRLKGEPQAPRWSAELIEVLARAVAAAHDREVIHRDLKPRNVVFSADGTPKVTDYGLAKLLDEDPGLTQTGQSPGTPSYMAPEQAGSTVHAVGPATDVYALGAILYELLTGGAPFRGTTVLETLELVRTQEPVAPSRLQPKIPRDLETICLKCLEKDPARRYANAEALGADLRRFLEGRPVLACRTSPLERAWRWGKRNRALAAAIVALGVVTWAGFTGMTWLSSLASGERTTAEHLGGLIGTLERYSALASSSTIEAGELDPRRREVLVEVRDELEALDRKYHDNLRLKHSLVFALIRVSQIEADLKEKERAVLSIHRAIDRAEALLKEDPQSVLFREALVKACHWSLTVETDHPRAIAAHRRATTILETLIRDVPDKARHYREQQCMNNYYFAKQILAAGERAHSITLFQEARRLGEALLREQPGYTLMLRVVGRAYSFLGELENQDHQADASESSYRRSNELFRQVLENEPGSLETLMEYATSCEQLVNIYADRNKVDEATKFAAETCRALEEPRVGNVRPVRERFAIQSRLARALYRLEIQHGQNLGALNTEPKGYARELEAAEKVCLRVHRIAETFRTLGASDPDLDYYDCMSCFNMYVILSANSLNRPDPRTWLVQAHKLVPTNASSEADPERRSHYQTVEETYKSVLKDGKE